MSNMLTPQLKSHPIQVNEDDPFRNDQLNRKKVAEPLTAILASVRTESLVLAVNAPWGFGKTTFISMWIAQLRLEGWHVVEFNAWENDFSDNAFASVLAELGDGLRSVKSQKIQVALSRVKDTGKELAKRILPVGARLITAGIVDDKVVESAVGDAAASAMRDLLSHYLATKRSIHKFRSTLAELASESHKETGKPLLVFIDELDRCRPTYAIEMLEAIKHLFEVPGVAFVVSIDTDQIRNAFRSVYGDRMNATEYLRRFVDLEFMLPQPTGEHYIDLLWKRFGIEEFSRQREFDSLDIQTMKKILGNTVSLLGSQMSLRRQEQMVMRIALCLRMIVPKYLVFADALVVLIVGREINRDAYESLCASTCSPGEYLDRLYEDLQPKNSLAYRRSDDLAWVEGTLLALSNQSRYAGEINGYKSSAESPSAPNRAYAQHLMSAYAQNQKWGGALYSYLFSKIELTEQFVDAG